MPTRATLYCGGCGIKLFRPLNRKALARQEHAFTSRCGAYVRSDEWDSWQDGRLTTAELEQRTAGRCETAEPRVAARPGVISRRSGLAED